MYINECGGGVYSQASENERDLKRQHSLLLSHYKQDRTLRLVGQHVHRHTHSLRLKVKRETQRTDINLYVQVKNVTC